jgi:hypothetical protein
MDFCVGINGLKLDLFYSTLIADSSFAENFFCASTDTGVSIVDIVVKDSMSFMITIGNSKVRALKIDTLPLKECLDPASTDLFDILQ